MQQRVLVLALVALVLMSVVMQVLGACPHNCNNHGDCHHGTCRCNTGWAGDDCSEADTPLESGQVVHDSLRSFTWHYYHIQVPIGTSALNVTAHQTSRTGDVDVYVQRDRFPTERDYVARDIGTDVDSWVQVNSPPPGRWYIGLYGYWRVEYDLQVDIILDCPVDCGPNGQCSGRTCICHSPYAGETCNIYDRPLSSGVSFVESVVTGEWKFFHISTAPDNFLDVVVLEDGTGDVDIYLKHDGYPSFFDFDYLNGTTRPLSTVHLDDPSVGVWTIGVYGYRGDRFNITATVGQAVGCAGLCSGESHGQCVGRRCQCNSDYGGDHCERKRSALQLDSEVTGYVETNYWNYYNFRVVTQNNVIIHVVQTGNFANQDCDVFVKGNEDPTRTSYDFANLSNLQVFNVTISEPGDTTWHVGVYGWTTCAYTLSISIPISCSCVGDHGHCEPNSDVCICAPGWSGVTCEEHNIILNLGQVYTGFSVQQYQWQYFSVSSNSSAMLVSLRETSTTGFLWLYISQGSYPTLETFDKADKHTNSDFHEVHLTFKGPEVRLFYIGVYGNPFGVRGTDGTPYSITAWAPPF